MMKTTNVQREEGGVSGIRINKGKIVVDRVFRGICSFFLDDDYGGYRESFEKMDVRLLCFFS